MTVPTRVVNSTMIGGMMFGRMCRHRMRLVEAPIDWAACTYMFSRTETTAERMMREPRDAEQQAEHADDLRQARAEHGHHDQQDDQIGKAHPGVDEALHDQVELAAEIAGEDADHDRDERCQRGCSEGR